MMAVAVKFFRTISDEEKSMSTNLTYQAILDLPFEAAVEKTIAALQEEGFGVLTQIDVKATLKEKLGEDVEPHVILGACNPPLAHKAISSAPLVSLLLPCNVTVRQTEEGSLVSIINPQTMLGIEDLGENPAIGEVAAEAAARLQRVAEALRGD
jgi:uncharacterized protein (DUF302 family)